MAFDFRLFINSTFKTYWKDLVHLVYPSLCIICEKELSIYEEQFCSFCFEELKYSGLENYTNESKLDKLFWGRIPIQHTFSLLIFDKKGSTQKIVHPIKYKNRKDLAVYLGTLIGEKIKNSPISYTELDFLVPIPLHINKRFTRGYNQSEELAKGISALLSVRVDTQFLIRVKNAESQTKKSKFLRWDNIQESFQVKKGIKTPITHIALVDDVITTGSTLETCVQVILKEYPSCKISLFSLAFVK
ncbi:MAG: ComF family protein [Flavobacteriia bacterium]|nr:ComF family protein [Flavobacteriia bacterium]